MLPSQRWYCRSRRYVYFLSNGAMVSSNMPNSMFEFYYIAEQGWPATCTSVYGCDINALSRHGLLSLLFYHY